jgi:CheY-like chemotaxis protein/anti-sigma regulatory factor (Ser/Thr protein kinase)
VLNDVLDMSKIEAEKLSLEATHFLPGELVNKVEALHRLKATEKGLAFACHVSPASERPRLGDPGRLAQVLHNLVGNAVKFTETGGITVTLAEGSGDALELTVRDTGIGMTEEQLSRVFEDFEQADGTVTRRFGGTGLGMSIVRRLVELMSGEIMLESEVGRGTTVRVSLPLPLAETAAETANPPESRAITGVRVLAADDNATNRTILSTMLERLGMDVVSVADGLAAVDIWEPGRFDLYLLDISMPGLDGISTLASLRAREAQAGLPPTPALAITANVMSHQVAAYLEAGFLGHLGKPFRQEDLVAALSRISVDGCEDAVTASP